LKSIIRGTDCKGGDDTYNTRKGKNGRFRISERDNCWKKTWKK